jgi:Dolichyl-phosphate-mannose-protein mannosyltransferase
MCAPSRRLTTKAPRVLLLIILAAGAALRFWAIGFGLPHSFARPDEEHIAEAALGVLRGDFNPHMFLYPSLFVYLTSVGSALLVLVERAASIVDGSARSTLMTLPESTIRLVARVLSAAAGVATVAALYGAARLLFSTRTALPSAAFLAVAFLHVRDSHFGVTDVPMTLLVVCAFWSAARCWTQGITIARAAFTGVLCGLAASTKYNAVFVVLPALVVFASATGGPRLPASRAVMAFCVLGGCLVLAFLLTTPFALLDRPAFLSGLVLQRRVALGLEHSPILDDARRIVGEMGWSHHLTFSLYYGLGLPLLVLSLAGASWMTIAQPRHAAVVLAFPIAFYVVMGASTLVYARWIVPVVPFLCLTAGYLVDRLAAMARASVDARAAPPAVSIFLVVLMGAPTAAQSVRFDRLIARTDTRLLGAGWIERHYPAGATMYQTGRLYGQLEPAPEGSYRRRSFDPRSGGFTPIDPDVSEPALTLPDLIVVLDSPLEIFNRVPASLLPVLDAHYILVEQFATAGALRASDALYDQQDAFYVPYSNPASVRRPGPNVRIFERRQ